MRLASRLLIVAAVAGGAGRQTALADAERFRGTDGAGLHARVAADLGRPEPIGRTRPGSEVAALGITSTDAALLVGGR